MSLSKQKQQEKYEDYLRTYSGRRLLEQHSLEESGVWQVFGEDPNCDFGGHHHEPFLGLIEGALDDVIREAVQYGNFWQWGYGGKIVKYADPAIKQAKTKAQRDNMEHEELSKMRDELQEALARVNAKLDALK
jgi:hypothetical protein